MQNHLHYSHTGRRFILSRELWESLATPRQRCFPGKQQEVHAALATGGQCRASQEPCAKLHTRGELEGHRYPIVYWGSFWSEHFSVERVQDIQFHALKEASAFVLKDNRHSNLAVVLEVSLNIIGLQTKRKMSQEGVWNLKEQNTAWG